jgi:hypothetical protein
MQRGLDLLLRHRNADPSRVAVTGLSGGGWQTIFFSPLDTRVTLTNPVAGYSSFVTRTRHFSDLGDSEQTPCDLATVLDYKHLTALMAPRPTLLTFNLKDNCCFASGHALPPLMEASRPVFDLFEQSSRLRSHVNEDPGDHNYGLDNRQAFYRMLTDFWSTADQRFDPFETPSDSEVKTPEALTVDLPAENLDLSTLARQLARALPNTPKSARSHSERRLELRGLVKPLDNPAQAELLTESESDGLKTKTWTVKIGGDFSLPVVELISTKDDKAGRGTTIIIADAGRNSDEVKTAVREAVESGQRVLVADLFYFGESKLPQRDYLFALLVGTVGERPLGIQTGQLLSLGRWLKSQTQNGKQPTTLVAIGPRSSTIALIAAALDESAFNRVTLHAPMASLKDVIERQDEFVKSPELFCFGLLESFDLKQIAELISPRPLKVLSSSPGAMRTYSIP